MASRKTWLAALALAVSLSMAGAAFAAGTLKIGVAGAHSGDLAPYGLPTINAAKLVADKYNAKGGLNGMQVEIVPQDDQCKPEMASNAATKLVSDKVAAVIGHICSGATKAALPIYKEAKLVVISPSATNPPLTQSGDYPNFFRTIAPDDAQANVNVEFATGKLGLKKLAVIHDKGDYGKGFAEFCQAAIEKGGKAKVVLFEGVTPGAVDYSAVVQKIKQSGADGVIFGGYHPEASKIVSQMRKKKIKIPFLSDDGVKDDTFIKVAGEFADGVYATGPRDLSKNAVNVQAVKEHKDKFGTDPGMFFPEAYAAAQVLMNAIEKSKSTNFDDIVKVLRSDFVETSVGKIKFDAKGDAEGVGFSVYQVKGGKYVELQ